jgi:pyruvate formate lyase activating enzyme
MDSGIDYEFRTTCVYPFISKDNCRAIGYPIRGAKKLFLQQMSGTSVFNESFFLNNGRHLSLGEIMEIQNILKDYIETCEVR